MENSRKNKYINSVKVSLCYIGALIPLIFTSFREWAISGETGISIGILLRFLSPMDFVWSAFSIMCTTAIDYWFYCKNKEHDFNGWLKTLTITAFTSIYLAFAFFSGGSATNEVKAALIQNLCLGVMIACFFISGIVEFCIEKGSK